MSSLIGLLLWAAIGLSPLSVAIARGDNRPNILFIITDDQDLHMESVEHMPFLQQHIVSKGTAYKNHFCTVSLCCPSRVNLWTGRAAHNTNVTDLAPPYGGYPQIVNQGINSNYLPIWMQELGYNTYYVGKLWNQLNLENWNSPYVQGFNGSDLLLDPRAYDYWNASMSRNGQEPVSYEGRYSPDILAEKAYDFLREATAHEEPWMVTVAPISPHTNIHANSDNVNYGHSVTTPPVVAPRHRHLFQNYSIPRTANFNPTEHGAVGWMKALPLLNETEIAKNDEFQRARLQSLQSVDEMIAGLVEILEEKGLLDNTYIFYTTDNGYHISQHRLQPGKRCGFDTDINIPFIVKGPGVPEGHISEHVTSHGDVAPTLLNLAGGTRDDFDGSIIPISGPSDTEFSRTEHVNIEYWGLAEFENIGLSFPNGTYKGLRVVAPEYNLYYSVWCTGEREYYDVKRDPGQLHNYFTNAAPTDTYNISGRKFEHIINRLDALMVVLKSCKARRCTHPWEVLHPDGTVQSLKEALLETYDEFYATQPKVFFLSCELGYIAQQEGPPTVNAFDGSSVAMMYATDPNPWAQQPL